MEDREAKGWFVKELKKVSLLAAPMVVVSVSQNLLPPISLMMAGHLGELHLSAVSVATSFTNATGFALLVNPFHIGLALLFFNYIS